MHLSDSHLPDIVPIFPLPEHVLLPAAPTPLRIFEPEVRQMVLDLLEKRAQERWLVIPRVVATHPGERDDPAPFHPVAALALMTLATPLSDGDFLIVVEGLHPCRVHEVDAPFTPYRVGRVAPLSDEGDSDDGQAGTDAVIQGAMSLMKALGPAAADFSVACGGRPTQHHIVYRIGAAILDDADRRQALLDERSPARRRRMVYGAMVDLLDVATRSGYQAMSPSDSMC